MRPLREESEMRREGYHQGILNEDDDAKNCHDSENESSVERADK